MEESRKNRFIIGAGLLIIAFALYKYKNNNKSKPKPKTNELKEEIKIPKYSTKGLPKRFIEDVEKMDVEKLKITIRANKNILNDSKVSDDEKEAIESMLDYLEHELKERQ